MSLSIFRIHICDGSPRGKRISYHCIIFSLWKGKKKSKTPPKSSKTKSSWPRWRWSQPCRHSLVTTNPKIKEKEEEKEVNHVYLIVVDRPIVGWHGIASKRKWCNSQKWEGKVNPIYIIWLSCISELSKLVRNEE